MNGPPRPEPAGGREGIMRRIMERYADPGFLATVDPGYVGGPESGALRMAGRVIKEGTLRVVRPITEGIKDYLKFQKEAVAYESIIIGGILGGSLFLGLKALGWGANTILGKQFADARKSGKDIWEKGKPREDAIKQLVGQFKSTMQTLQKEAASVLRK